MFNLRSALDHLVCGLVRKYDPSAHCAKQEFPVCTTPEAFDNALRRKHLAGLSIEAISHIRSIQPFTIADRSRTLHPLWLLRELNNEDKHRAVHITLGASKAVEAILTDRNDRQVHAVSLPPTIDMGPVMVPLPPDVPDFVSAKCRGTFTITFRSIEALQGRAVHDVLATCINYVETKVFRNIAPLFREQPNPL